MYGQGSFSGVASGATVTGVGVITLPYTSGNIFGTILSVSIIAIGVLVLASQVAVRIMRRKYQA